MVPSTLYCLTSSKMFRFFESKPQRCVDRLSLILSASHYVTETRISSGANAFAYLMLLISWVFVSVVEPEP
jgi:hypothetical protein